MAFSPDGKVLATGSADGLAKLWDLETGRVVRTLAGHKGRIDSLAWSPDGKTLATGSFDHTANLWDVDTGRVKHALTKHRFGVTAVAFSPNGKLLVTAGRDDTAELWDVATGQDLRTVARHSTVIRSAAFSHDGRTLATGGGDGVVLLSDVTTGRPLHELAQHSKAVLTVAFSQDDETLATGSEDATVKLWSVKSGDLLKTLTKHGYWIVFVEFSPDRRSIAVGGFEGPLELWDLEGKHPKRTLAVNPGWVKSFAFTSDWRKLAAGGVDHLARIWDTTSGRMERVLAGRSSKVFSVEFSTKAPRLAIGSDDSAIRIWDLNASGQPQVLVGQTGEIRCVAFSPDGTKLASTSTDNTIELWDLANPGEGTVLSRRSGTVWSVAWSPNGQALASAGLDQTVRIQGISDHSERILPNPRVMVLGVAFSPDGESLATGSARGIARIYDVASGKEETPPFVGHTGWIFAVAFSPPDGKILATASTDQTVRLWDVATHRTLHILAKHSDAAAALAFSPDGTILASGSPDRTIKLWDVATGNVVRTLSGHHGSVTSLSFWREGNILATGSLDGTTKLWDVATGDELCTLMSFTDGTWVVTDPEGRFDASNGGDVDGLCWVMDGTFEPIDLEQFRNVYYTPGLLSSIWARKRLAKVPNIQELKLYPKVEASIRGNVGKITLTNRGGGIGRVRVRFNGQQIREFNADPSHPDFDPTLPSKILSVDLSGLARNPGGDRLDALAWTRDGTVRSRGATDVSPTEAKPLTRYFAIVSGIADYASPSLHLDFSADDAVAMTRSLLVAAHGLDPKPKIRLYLLCDSPEAKKLASSEVTVLEPDRAGFDRAFQEIARARLGPSDLFLLYLSGHGVGLGDRVRHYAYLTQDARSGDSQSLANPDVRKVWAITDDDLIAYLRPITGGPKKVMILDTCYAGALGDAVLAMKSGDQDPTTAALDLRDGTGFHLLLASAKDRAAYESPAYRHGFLTYTLLHELRNSQLGSAQNPDAVEVGRWFDESANFTQELAKRNHALQVPVAPRPDGASFPIGFLSNAMRAQIPLEAARPQVGPALLVNQATDEVDEDLSREVTTAIRQGMKARGEGLAVFSPTPDTPDVIRLSGNYATEGVTLKVHVNLKRNGKVINSFDVSGARSEIPALVLVKLEAFLKSPP